MAFPVLASGTHAAPGSASGFVVRSSWLEPETMALMHLDLTALLLRQPSPSPWGGHTETEGTHSGAAVGPGIHPVLGGVPTLEQQDLFSPPVLIVSRERER